jgi:RHS repeat-associated protein
MIRVYHSVLAAGVRCLVFLQNRTGANRKRCDAFPSALERCLRRVVCVALIVTLLTTSTPAATETVVGVGKEWRASLGFWLRANGLPAKWYRKLTAQEARPQQQDTQESRDAKVSSIKVYPGDRQLYVDERVTLAAVAYDSNGTPIGGIHFKWSSWDEGRKRLFYVSQRGDFEAHLPGTFNVTAEGASHKGHVTITVLDVKERVRRNENPGPGTPLSTRDLPPPISGTAKLRTGQNAHPWKSGGASSQPASADGKRAAVKTKGATVNTVPAPVMPLLADEGGWDPGNYWSADDPPNRRGDPPGVPLDGGAGSSNFQSSAKVLGLQGRGLSVSLALAVNSRMWNKANSQLNYDIDRDWPAPGFSLGFGKLLGIAGGSMIVDADGTRHGFSGSISPSGRHFDAHTTDGSLIDYWHDTNSIGWITSGQAKLSNGTVIEYGAHGPGGVFPTRITDANGNYVTITYVNDAGPQIQTVTDTLGRVITFYYNENNLLTAINEPRLDDGNCTPGQPCTRTVVRLHYKQQPLGYDFPGMAVVVRDPNPWVIDAIYYPATSTGYWFGDSDSYSTYGMLAKVIEQRGMSFAANSLNDQGTVTPGQMTWKEVYNYPLFVGDTSGTASTNLNNAPTYTSMTRTWKIDGSTDNVVTATSSYLVQENATNPSQQTIPSRKVEITQPNGTKSIQYSYDYTNLLDANPLKALDGIVYQDETRDSSGALLKSGLSTWEKGAYDSPRPRRMESTNERSQTRAVEFVYTDGSYNQAAQILTHDYDGAILSSVDTQYQNSPNYTNRHIFNLPLIVEAFTGDHSNRVSKTDYQYDGETLTARPNVIKHDQAFNPYAAAEGYCYYTPDMNDPDCRGECNEFSPTSPNSPGCDGYCGDVYICPYNSTTNFRGNLTQITTYANVTSQSAGDARTEQRLYDITGNVVKVSTGCCEHTTFKYGTDESPLATQYAYVLSQTTGSATDLQAQVTTRTTYDFNTGMPLSSTDANGRVSQTSYNANTLRVERIILASGSHTDYAYDDVGMSVTESTYLGSHPTDAGLADQSTRLLNGLGQVRREKSLGANGVWDSVDISYDSMNRVSQQSLPYRNDDPLQWNIPTYDGLNRVISVQAPDGSMVQTFFNEITRPAVASSTPGETTRLRDAWGRERWGRMDARGRLVEVVEPNPDGSGSVFESGALLTTYAYDTQGNLTTITQGEQSRSFKYDSMGRLIARKLAETTATLNDSGTYVGAGGSGAQWSDFLKYDISSNVVQRIDARGVKTNFWYFDSQNHTDPADETPSDPLNRLQSISYDTSNDPNHGLQPTDPNYYLRVLDAPAVTYHYRTRNSEVDLKDVTELESVTTSDVSTESFLYDLDGRVTTKTLRFNNRSSYPLITDYVYDNLGRLKDIYYPGKDLLNNSARKHVEPSYDVASRLSQLTVDNQLHAGNINYDASSRATTLEVGANGPNKITENYSFEPQTGLLSHQTVVRGTDTEHPLLDLSYDYKDSNNKRTGQLTKILNNLNHNKDRSYAYDALARLKQAAGGPAGSPLWTQNYGYDRYGNRTSVTASGYSARNGSATSGSAGILSAVSTQSEPAAHRDLQKGGLLEVADATGSRASSVNGSLSDSTSKSLALTAQSAKANHASRIPRTTPAPQSGPPVFTDDPLVPGVTVIKAVHIIELRTAVNQARSRASLAPASWAESVSPGVFIKAAHIMELRTRLDEARAALGLSTASYTDPSLGMWTTVKAAHVQELRQRVTEALTTNFAIPVDGIANLSYDLMNRITTAGFDYDKAGNQIRALAPGGGSQRFQYDAANRLANVRTEASVIIASYTYGDTNERLIKEESGLRTYYASEAGSVLAEYNESGSSMTPVWFKTYVYLGERLLSTLEDNGAGGEVLQHHHPDRLGTRLVTNPATGSSFEQVGLPFGTALAAESTGATNRRFTSYDRSTATGLDYAVNRHYDSQQGRFTQVDPAGMRATDLESPQTLNLYSYCTNDPINQADPSGLGFFSFLKKAFKWILVGLAIAAAVVAIVCAPALFAPGLQTILGIIGAVADAASQLLNAVNLKTAGMVLGIISAGASFVSSIFSIKLNNWKSIMKAVSDGAALQSKVLTLAGHKKLGQIFDLVSGVTGFLAKGIKSDAIKDKDGKVTGYKNYWKLKNQEWEIYKFARKTAEQIATIAGATRVADYLNVAGIVDDAVDFGMSVKELMSKGLDGEDGFKWKDKKQDPSSALYEKARSYTRWRNGFKLAKDQSNRISRILMRVEKGIALAH